MSEKTDLNFKISYFLNTFLPFIKASYFAIHDVTTVSLLKPSISGNKRIFFSA